MLIFIKKGNLCLFAGVFVLCIITGGLALRQSADVKDAVAVPGFGKRIVLDAGHGEPDGGASTTKGVLEKDINLNITRFLQGYLEQSGIEVFLTRADDKGIYDENSKTIREKKRSDLQNRKMIMNESEADLFVSIHLNKFTEAKYSGPQVFYGTQNPASKELAESVQQSMISVLVPPSERSVKQAGKEIYLLSQAKIPSVLIECGFLSNEKEAELLQTEDYQKRVAWSVYCGLLQYFAKT